MKKLLAAMVLVVCSLFLMPAVFAQVQMFEATDEYIMSDYETREFAQQRAQERAKQKAIYKAQEMAGVFLKSHSRYVVHVELNDDEIAAAIANILKVQYVQYQMEQDYDSLNKSIMFIKATVKATIDTKDFEKLIEKNSDSRSIIVNQNKELQKSVDENYKQAAELKERIAKVDNKPVEPEKPALSKPKTNETDIIALTKQNDELLKQIEESNRRIDELKRELAEKERLAKKIADENNPTLKQKVDGQIFEGVGEYRMGERDTLEFAKKNAKSYAMRDALERAGVIVNSYSKSVDGELKKDVITTKSRAVLKVIEVKPEWKDFVCRMTIKVDINVAELNKWLEQEAKKSK